MVLWRPTRPSRINTKKKKKKRKRCPFHHGGMEWKSRKSRDTWRNRHIWPWSTKWSRAKANRVLPREHSGHSKHYLPTPEETTLHMYITKWSISLPDWLYSLQLMMEKLYKDLELTVTQIMRYLMQNSGLNWSKYSKSLGLSCMT